MEQLRSAWTNYPYCVTGVLTVPVAYVLFRKYCGSQKQPRIECQPNTVLLHQMTRGPYAPSLSNFSVKLETYLRMAGIPYINDLSGQFSPKGKTPFITYNGEDVSDTHFIIEYLNKKLNINLNKDLNQEQLAFAKAFQVLADEYLYWILVYSRWVYDKNLTIIKMGLPGSPCLIWKLKKTMVRRVIGQGMGVHSAEEIKRIFLADLQALSDFLGNKQFLMGSTPCEVDCSVFGLLSQFIWQAVDDLCGNVIQEKFPALNEYCLRMRERFWPDWDDCITHGGTRPAIK
ncbi:unnamed protein product [Candidula unifasciata]|uniref:Failed axon connections homolog n=1 Tax=Candidula unifasciata TaxID=100452 RepID=A0A8S3YS53_9EUPU|nr:unnamed protein product [Candidula unifasciata]